MNDVGDGRVVRGEMEEVGERGDYVDAGSTASPLSSAVLLPAKVFFERCICCTIISDRIARRESRLHRSISLPLCAPR